MKKKTTPERFNTICDTLYEMVRRVHKLTNKRVGFEVMKFDGEKLGVYSALTVAVRGEGRSAEFYDICDLFNDDAEKAFEKVKERLNGILSETSEQDKKGE